MLETGYSGYLKTNQELIFGARKPTSFRIAHEPTKGIYSPRVACNVHASSTQYVVLVRRKKRAAMMRVMRRIYRVRGATHWGQPKLWT